MKTLTDHAVIAKRCTASTASIGILVLSGGLLEGVRVYLLIPEGGV